MCHERVSLPPTACRKTKHSGQKCHNRCRSEYYRIFLSYSKKESRITFTLMLTSRTPNFWLINAFLMPVKSNFCNCLSWWLPHYRHDRSKQLKLLCPTMKSVMMYGTSLDHRQRASQVQVLELKGGHKWKWKRNGKGKSKSKSKSESETESNSNSESNNMSRLEIVIKIKNQFL